MSYREDHFEEMNRFFEQMRQSILGASGFGGAVNAPALDLPMTGDATDERATDYPMGDRRSPVRRGGMGDWSSMSTNVTVEPTDEGYVVMADLPGFETDDLSIRFEEGILTIHGESDVAEEADYTVRRRSRRVHEQLSFPSSVLVEEISASYHNGVLEVVLPTEDADDDDSHRIDIE